MSKRSSLRQRVGDGLRRVVPAFVRRSYALKFAVVFVLLGTTMGSAGLGATTLFAEDVRDNADQKLAELASQHAERVESWATHQSDIARLITADEALESGDPEAVERHLNSRISTLPPSLLMIHFVDVSDGEVVASTNAELQGVPLERIDERWAGGLDFEGATHVTAPYTRFGVTRVAVIQRVSGQSGRVIVMEVESRLISSVTESDDASRGIGYVEFVTQDGQVVLSQRPSRIGESYRDGGRRSEVVDLAFSTQTAGTTATDTNEFVKGELNTGSYLVSYAQVEGTDWSVLVHARQQAVYGSAQTIVSVGSVATGIAVLFIGLLGVLLGKHTSTAIDRLVGKAKQMGQGNLNVAFDTNRIDNIGRLYGEFDRAQESIRDHIEEARLVEHSYDLITVLRPDGTVAYQGPSVEHIVGFEPEEFEGERLLDRIHEADTGAVQSAIDGVIETPDSPQRFTFRMRNAAGEWRYFQSVCENHLDDPFVGGIIVSSRDITEREKQRAKIQEQNERLDKFASVVSHDLRNPLNVAQGRLEFCDDSDGEHLSAIERSLDRMEAMIDDLLTMARAGETVEDTDPVALADAVRDAWEHAESSDCECELLVPEGMTVEADRDRLLHVFENLFRNAAEHNTTPLTVRVGSLDTANDDSGQGFFIEDDGSGIPEDDRETVFEHGYSTSNDGTGFGLSIVEDIVEAHGWEVRVTESPEGGARYEITGVEIDR